MSLILFKNCTLLDFKNAEPLSGHHVLIEDQHIREISDRPIETKLAQTYDIKDKVLMPGLIDAHVHVTWPYLNFEKNATLSKSYLAVRAAQTLEMMLQRGFTTVRDACGADFGLAEAVNQGYIKGPRLFYSGYALSQSGGHGDFRSRNSEEFSACQCEMMGIHMRIADGVAAVQKAAREELRKGAHQIKIMASGGVISPYDPIDNTQFSLAEIQAIVDEAAAWKTYVMAHAYTPAAITRAIQCGVRSIEHGNLMDAATAKLMKKHEAFLVPTLITYHATERSGRQFNFADHNMNKLAEVKKAGLEAISLCKKAGVKIGHGSDLLGELQIHQSEEFLLKSEVLKPHECLEAATATNAELLNMPGKLGVIAPGAYADLLVVNGNPLKNLNLLQEEGKHFSAIMKNGVFYKNELS
jgi:imidazolonepropionase-like amidohydrolase